MVDILKKHNQIICHFFSKWLGILLITVFVISGCSPAPNQTSDISNDGKRTLENPEEFANKLIKLIANDDIAALTEFIEPNQGLTFSPYVYVEEIAVVLSADQLVKAWEVNRSYKWGYYDGSGEPISLKIKDYFKEFVYDNTYENRAKLVIDLKKSSGNTIVNISTVFPDATIVEFHVPGSNPKYGGMDWSSLYCVLVSKNNYGWWLVALVHDQWTI